jgi:hypothetical protein
MFSSNNGLCHRSIDTPRCIFQSRVGIGELPWYSRQPSSRIIIVVVPLPSGAFDYEFGALDNLDNPLTKSYTDLVYSTFGIPSHAQLLFVNLCRYFPSRFIRYVFETGSDPALRKARDNRIHAHRVARELIEQKRQEMLVGQSGKDVLSLLGASPHVAFLGCQV